MRAAAGEPPKAASAPLALHRISLNGIPADPPTQLYHPATRPSSNVHATRMHDLHQPVSCLAVHDEPGALYSYMASTVVDGFAACLMVSAGFAAASGAIDLWLHEDAATLVPQRLRHRRFCAEAGPSPAPTACRFLNDSLARLPGRKLEAAVTAAAAAAPPPPVTALQLPAGGATEGCR